MYTVSSSEKFFADFKGFIPSIIRDIPRWLQQLVVFSFMHLLFIFACGYYYKTLHKEQQIPRTLIAAILLKLRGHISLFMASLPAMQNALEVYVNKNVVWVNHIRCGIVIISWLLHYRYLGLLEKGFSRYAFGHFSVHCGWVFTVMGTIHQMLFSFTAHPNDVNEQINYIFTLLICLFHFLYFMVLLISSMTAHIHQCENCVHLAKMQLICEEFRKMYNLIKENCKSAYSSLCFIWVKPLISKGTTNELQSFDDLFELPNSLKANVIDNEFCEAYEQLQEKLDYFSCSFSHSSKDTKRHTPLFETLMECYGLSCFSIGIFKLISDCTWIFSVIILLKILMILENPNVLPDSYYVFPIWLGCSSFISSIFNCQYFYHIYNIGSKIRSSVISTIFRKTFHIRCNEFKKLNPAEMVQFMNTDAEKIQNLCSNFHSVWSLSLQVLACTYLLHLQMKWACLCGVVFGVIVIYVNFHINKRLTESNSKLMLKYNSRLKMVEEIVEGFESIKFYSWENFFENYVSNHRHDELRALNERKKLDAFCVYFWAASTILISFFTFLIHSLVFEESLSTTKVLIASVLFSHLITSLNTLPWSVSELSDAWTSLQRVENFLQIPDVNTQMILSKIDDINPSLLIYVEKGIFTWENAPKIQAITSDTLPLKYIKDQVSANFELGPIDLEIYAGQFVGIYGMTGSGKSSLLNSLLGEMYKKEGTIAIRDIEEGFGYVSQHPWIQHGTLKSNILFGLDFNEDYYHKVVQACGLSGIIENFSEKDETIIGDRKSVLTKSLKMRICLARALYQNKEIYLLDDPFSVLSGRVGLRIFNKCIKGLLGKKTRILCTNRRNFLTQADYVIVLKSGKIIETGPPASVFASSVSQSSLSSLLESEDWSSPASKISPCSVEIKSNEIKLAQILDNLEQLKDVRFKYSDVKECWYSVGKFFAPAILISFGLMQVSRTLIDVWLACGYVYCMNKISKDLQKVKAYDTENISEFDIKLLYVQSEDDHNLKWYPSPLKFPYNFFAIYWGLIALYSVISLCRGILQGKGGIAASHGIHNMLLERMLKAPLCLFDSIAACDILALFSTNIHSLDETLPFMLNVFLMHLCCLISIIILVSCSLPCILIVFTFIGLYYFGLQKDYRKTVSRLNKFSSSSLSQLFAGFSEIFSGLIIIRAFRSNNQILQMCLNKLNINQRSVFAVQMSGIWLNFQLHSIGIILITCVSVVIICYCSSETRSISGFFVLTPLFFDDQIARALLSLILTYVFDITNTLNNLLWAFIETEKEFKNCCKIFETIENMVPEKWTGINKPEWNWPHRGAIYFENVTLKKSCSSMTVLKNLTFNIYPGEKFGIINKGDLGKSEIFQALFRSEELIRGYIEIDDVKIHELDLRDLRSRIAIIPQKPFFFKGSVRDNLDPARKYTLYEIWKMLERCHVVDPIYKLGGLDEEIPLRGQNFTLSQKQLLCLARALLANSRVICYEEPIFVVDYEVSEIFHEIFDSETPGKTIIIATHRAETVMNCNRIMILCKGEIIELDSPDNLLEKSESEFFRLITKNLALDGKIVKSQKNDKLCPKLCASTTW